MIHLFLFFASCLMSVFYEANACCFALKCGQGHRMLMTEAAASIMVVDIDLFTLSSIVAQGEIEGECRACPLD